MTIHNQEQYKLTRLQAENFRRVIAEEQAKLGRLSTERDFIELQVAALTGQLEDLDAELDEFDLARTLAAEEEVRQEKIS
jgi:hypothetical protein